MGLLRLILVVSFPNRLKCGGIIGPADGPLRGLECSLKTLLILRNPFQPRSRRVHEIQQAVEAQLPHGQFELLSGFQAPHIFGENIGEVSLNAADVAGARQAGRKQQQAHD